MMANNLLAIGPPFTLQLPMVQGLAPVLQSLVEELLREWTPRDAAIYGSSGLLAVGVVRWFVKRRASSGTATGTSVSTTAGSSVSTTTPSTSTASSTRHTGANKHNVAFTLPSILPLSQGIRNVTHNEIHALELGLVVGVLVLWLLSLGKQGVVRNLVITFVAGTLGYKRYSSKAFKTTRYEPWYALLALGAGGVLGWAIFMREPSLLTLLGV